MAINPMQRKSRNSFLLGMLIMAILAGGAIAFLIMQLNDANEKMAHAQSGAVYVLNTDVKSGQILTQDMFDLVKVHPDMVPANSTGILDYFTSSYLVDQNGNQIHGDSVTGFYYEGTNNSSNSNSNGTANNNNSNNATGNTSNELQQTIRINIYKGNDGKYYYRDPDTNEPQRVIIGGAPVVAKIDIAADTPVTTDMIAYRDELVNQDVRLEEYNMLKLPSTLTAGEYIDIRLTLPTGQDYIVVSKKEVKQCDLTTIWIEMSEDEITIMNNAIIESYIMPSAQLYATRYVEPGLQVAATPTYPVSQVVRTARENNPNILQEAIDAYNDRVAQNNPTQDRNYIEQALSQYAEDRLDNVEDGVETSRTQAMESREEYLEGLM